MMWMTMELWWPFICTGLIWFKAYSYTAIKWASFTIINRLMHVGLWYPRIYMSRVTLYLDPYIFMYWRLRSHCDIMI